MSGNDSIICNYSYLPMNLNNRTFLIVTFEGRNLFNSVVDNAIKVFSIEIQRNMKSKVPTINVSTSIMLQNYQTDRESII